MLTNLFFINSGERFPPSSEIERLEMYARNKLLFETEHVHVYEDALKRIQRVIGNFEDVISYPVVFNFQKLISLKTADLLIGEPPQISAGEKGSPEQIAVDTIIERSKLYDTLGRNIVDVSRYGDGLLNVRDRGGSGVIDLTQPPLWFPVVDPDNVLEIKHHVLAWTFDEIIGDKKFKRLKVRIHSKGEYEERIHGMDGTMIMPQIGESVVVKTGLSDFAIIQVSNTITSDRITGLDDYTDVDTIVAELMVRVGQIARILDKHASPSMTGSPSALERDPVSGGWRLKSANFFPRDSKDDPELAYVTWDGELTANFTQVEKLINMLYTISEMGSALFGDMSQSAGQIPSGSALRRLMLSPLSKVSRIRTRLDYALKNAIMLCSQLGGKDIIDLTNTTISITWADGLPEDPTEMATVMDIRTGKKATISQLSAIKKLDDLDDEAADEELARIQDDETSLNPMVMPPFSQTSDTVAPVVDKNMDKMDKKESTDHRGTPDQLK